MLQGFWFICILITSIAELAMSDLLEAIFNQLNLQICILAYVEVFYFLFSLCVLNF